MASKETVYLNKNKKIVNSISYKKFIQFLVTQIRGVMNGEVTFSFRMDQHTAVVFVFKLTLHAAILLKALSLLQTK